MSITKLRAEEEVNKGSRIVGRQSIDSQGEEKLSGGNTPPVREFDELLSTRLEYGFAVFGADEERDNLGESGRVLR